MDEGGEVGGDAGTTVDLEVIGGGTVDGVPGDGDARRGDGVLDGSEDGSLERVVGLLVGELARVLEALDREGLGVLRDVGLGELHVELGRRGDLGVCEVLALEAEGVEVGGLVIEIDRLTGLGLGGVEGGLVGDLDELELLAAVLGDDARGLGGDVHDERAHAAGVIPLVGAGGGVDREDAGSAGDLGGVVRGDAAAIGDGALGAVGLVARVLRVDGGGAVVLVAVVAPAALGRKELGDATGLVETLGVVLGLGLRVVVRLVHGDDGVGLHEDGKLPERGIVVVEHLTAAVLRAGEVVDPDVVLVARQVDAVADVIAVLVRLRVLVDGGNEEGVTVHVLVLHRGAGGVVRVLLEEHRADHRQAGVAVARVDVGCACRGGVEVRHQLALELEIEAVDGGVGVTVGVRGLDDVAPAVHVEHERRERLPLVVARGDDGVASAVDAVHVGADVGVARKALADVGGNVEADVLPVGAVLVAGPHGRVALGAGPAADGHDVRALADARGDDVVGLLEAVEPEGVAGADPCDVRLEGGDAALGDLALEVAKELPGRGRVGVDRQVGLGPEARLDAVGVGVLAEVGEVGDVGIDRGETLRRARAVLVHAANHAEAVLAVAGAVAVVGKEPAEGHVVLGVLVDDRASGVLVGRVVGREVVGLDGRTVAVERLGGEALGNHVTLAATILVAGRLLAGHGVSDGPGLAAVALVLGPAVTVVGVELAEIEGVLGQEHGVAGDLVVALQDVLGNVGDVLLGGDEVVGVELGLVVRRGDRGLVRGAKVVAAVGEGVAQHAVSVARPVEGVGACYAAIHPRALVGNVDGLAGVDEAAVLGAAAEEVLPVALLDVLDGGVLADLERRALLEDDLVAGLDGELARLLLENDGHGAARDLERGVAVADRGARLVLVLVGVVRLSLDLCGVARVARGGVLRELARRVDVVAEDAVIEEGDLTLDAVVEHDVDDVRLVLRDGRRRDARDGADVRLAVRHRCQGKRRGNCQRHACGDERLAGHSPLPGQHLPLPPHGYLSFDRDLPYGSRTLTRAA